MCFFAIFITHNIIRFYYFYLSTSMAAQKNLMKKVPIPRRNTVSSVYDEFVSSHERSDTDEGKIIIYLVSMLIL